ncbi:hypothetical protein MA16_Dca013889 [Dendrobium catenatum]|uniref:Uncharacterized protein n=1 Tax=Dendrobium catenatum TaxID=906689 RepID=A0A2I0WCQ9_9ASPA|nr:hypothetical protein MA16_Dca013889 [Dendrobium catenatum]
MAHAALELCTMTPKGPLCRSAPYSINKYGSTENSDVYSVVALNMVPEAIVDNHNISNAIYPSYIDVSNMEPKNLNDGDAGNIDSDCIPYSPPPDVVQQFVQTPIDVRLCEFNQVGCTGFVFDYWGWAGLCILRLGWICGSSVPNLSLDDLLIDADAPRSELHANGRFRLEAELVPRKPREEIRFTYSGVPNQHHLEQVIIVFVGPVRHNSKFRNVSFVRLRRFYSANESVIWFEPPPASPSRLRRTEGRARIWSSKEKPKF